MSLFTERDEYQVGSLQGGLPTCVFAPKTYHRIITNIVVGNSVTSGVKCYRGLLGSTPVAQNLLGSNNTLSGPIRIPAGQAFFVQWSAAGSNVKDAFARVSWERDDSPLEASGSGGGSSWSTEAVTSLQVPTAGLPGEPRLVIGTDLPIELRDYVFNAYGIGNAKYSAAIIFYARDDTPPVDNVYSYIAVVDHDTGVTACLVYGLVRDGVVQEFSAGRPLGLTHFAQGAGVTNQLNVLYDDITMSIPPGSAGEFSLHSANALRLSAIGLLELVSSTFNVELFASNDLVLRARNQVSRISLTTAITLSADGGDIVLNALGKITLGPVGPIVLSSLSDTTSEGNLLGLRNDNECTSVSATGNTSSAVYANVPGTNTLSITKRYAGSALLVTYMPTFFVTVSDTGPKFAVAIGGTDYDIIKQPQTLTASVRLQACGQRKITGIGAGVVTLTARWGRVAGTGSVNVISGDDWYSFTVQEIAA